MQRIAVVQDPPPRTMHRPDLAQLPATSSATEVRHALERDGAVVLRNLLDAATVSRINCELDPVLSGSRLGLGGGNLGQTRRLNSTLRHSHTIATEVITHPGLVDVARAVLGEHCTTLQLSVAHVAEVRPGEPALRLHRDDRLWGPIKGRVHPLSVVSIIALTEFTLERGATRVVPGSHRWDDAYEASVQRYSQGTYDDLAVPALLEPGCAVTFLGTTLHGAHANTTTDVYRRGLVVNYCVGWMRTEANNFLLYPPDFARTLPEPVQRLLGYQIEAENCGELETGEDPIVLLRQGDPSEASQSCQRCPRGGRAGSRRSDPAPQACADHRW